MPQGEKGGTATNHDRQKLLACLHVGAEKRSERAWNTPLRPLQRRRRRLTALGGSSYGPICHPVECRKKRRWCICASAWGRSCSRATFRTRLRSGCLSFASVVCSTTVLIHYRCCIFSLSARAIIMAGSRYAALPLAGQLFSYRWLDDRCRCTLAGDNSQSLTGEI